MIAATIPFIHPGDTQCRPVRQEKAYPKLEPLGPPQVRKAASLADILGYVTKRGQTIEPPAEVSDDPDKGPPLCMLPPEEIKRREEAASLKALDLARVASRSGLVIND